MPRRASPRLAAIPWASLVTASVLVAAVVLVAAGCASNVTVTATPTQPQSAAASASVEPSPSVASAAPSASTATAAPSESASPGASAEVGPCGPNDITVTATDAGGAAGSRGADVTVTAVGQASCRLTAHPMVAFLDAGGQVVLQTPIQVGDGPLVSAASPASFTFEMSNWCAPTSTPWTVVFATSVGTVPVAGIRYQQADLPPCNGPGEPPSLTTSDWAIGAN